MPQPFAINVLGSRFVLNCSDDLSATTLATCYSPFLADNQHRGSGNVQYQIESNAAGWRLTREAVDIQCPSLADLLYDFEKDITIKVQLARPDLLFIHAAVVCNGESAIVIASESGAGKSTLCWALCHHNYRYMSDELAPVHPDSGVVEGYPRALCLKTRPIARYALPDDVVDADRTLHVPAAVFPAPATAGPAKLAAIVFLDSKNDDPDKLQAQPISAGEAAVRLYANSLNQLAHDRFGLAAVTELASGVAAFRLCRADLDDMIHAVDAVVN